jgi:hypothetical protein
MVAGAAVQAIGAMKQGEAAADAAEYNKANALQNAEAARQSAAIEASRSRMLANKTLGAMRANFAATGVARTGSVEDVLADSAAQAKLDELLIRHRGELQARGYKAEAGLAGMQASAAREGAMFGAAGALIGGAAQVAGAYTRMN